MFSEKNINCIFWKLTPNCGAIVELDHFTVVEGIWCLRDSCIILPSLVTFPNLAKPRFGNWGSDNEDFLSTTALLTVVCSFAKASPILWGVASGKELGGRI